MEGKRAEEREIGRLKGLGTSVAALEKNAIGRPVRGRRHEVAGIHRAGRTTVWSRLARRPSTVAFFMKEHMALDRRSTESMVSNVDF